MLIGSLRVVFHGERRRRCGGTLTRDGGARRRDQHLDLSLQHGRVAKVVSIRDFFVTLFFVALGMQIPMPTFDVIEIALIASAFLIASRFVVVFPILRWLGLGHRTRPAAGDQPCADERVRDGHRGDRRRL
jgi:NhaP-type Na+/H+ or K+/H+ antiporter